MQENLTTKSYQKPRIGSHPVFNYYLNQLLKSCDKRGTENNCHWNIENWENIEIIHITWED